MPKLTKRQNEVLDLIKNQMDLTGSPPTRAEIAASMGFKSPNAAEDHLRALARKGIIELVPGTSRGIRLLQQSGGLPVIGRVAAGQPILATENVETNLKVDKYLFDPEPNYLLRVCGTSMQNSGILDGDLIAVHVTPEAYSGQIVVARLGDDVTVKRFKKNGYLVQLCPENPEHQPIEVDLRSQSLTIEGICVGVLRRFASKRATALQ